ncbi:hypothetical protein NDK47_22285 [Brevibacillus ruminantium]|uniref:Uncharacterized protein n=1 Tax=Brevibacillus ruminantium TaxID=2950604 RepID=A0ABY4WD46_9BACL|nr:hypothetical protein [Brevibacillus ruminantium]USG64824.1 hypothetical protein NDK47_22285 [Brevibacillus ruminantium]
MFKYLVFTLMITVLLVCTGIAALAKDFAAPADAQKFAKEQFPQIFQSYYETLDDPTRYGLENEIGNISFGPLHPVLAFTPEFLHGSQPADSYAAEPSDLWIAGIYQNGIPRLAISLYQKEDGTYSLANIGYGKDVALALEDVKAGEGVIEDGPTNSWYAFSPNASDPARSQIRPLNDIAKIISPSVSTLAELQPLLHEHYEQKFGSNWRQTEENAHAEAGGAVRAGNHEGKGRTPLFIMGVLFTVTAFLLMNVKKVGIRSNQNSQQ